MVPKKKYYLDLAKANVWQGEVDDQHFRVNWNK